MGRGTCLLGMCLVPQSCTAALGVSPAPAWAFPRALGQLGQSALLLHVPTLPFATASVCGCASQALEELLMSATNSAQNHVLYRFTTLQLLVAS